MYNFEFVKPATLDEALAALKDEDAQARIRAARAKRDRRLRPRPAGGGDAAEDLGHRQHPDRHGDQRGPVV